MGAQTHSPPRHLEAPRPKAQRAPPMARTSTRARSTCSLLPESSRPRNGVLPEPPGPPGRSARQARSIAMTSTSTVDRRGRPAPAKAGEQAVASRPGSVLRRCQAGGRRIPSRIAASASSAPWSAAPQPGLLITTEVLRAQRIAAEEIMLRRSRFPTSAHSADPDRDRRDI